MTTTEIELRTVDGQGALEANKDLLEQVAVSAFMDLMNKSVSPEIRLAAATSALRALGKAEPKASAPTTNIQINAALAGEAGKALAGLAQMAQLMSGQGQVSGDNAPQTPTLTGDKLGTV